MAVPSGKPGRAARCYFVMKCPSAAAMRQSVRSGLWRTPLRNTPPQLIDVILRAHREEG